MYVRMKPIAALMGVGGILALVLTVLRPGAETGVTSPPTPSGTQAPASSEFARIASDRYGLVVWDTRLWIRTETDPTPMVTLGDVGAFGAGSAIAVSPQGTALAVWTAGVTGSSELRLWRATSPHRTQLLLRTQGGERGTGLAWAADGGGLVLSLEVAQDSAEVSAPGPKLSVLRTLDLATGQLSEVARMPLTRLMPLAWDRDRSAVGAVDSGDGGFASSYFVIRGGEVSSTRLLMGQRHTFLVSASPDAGWIVASADIDGERRLLAWPLVEPGRAIELRPDPGHALMRLPWVGTGHDVLVGDLEIADPSASVRVSIWNPSQGVRSDVIAAPLRDASSRIDGSALYIHGRAGQTEVLDMRTGRRELLPDAPSGWLASVVLR